MVEHVRVVRYSIPAIGAAPGDRLVIRPGHPSAPLVVVKRYGHQTLVRMMGDGHLEPDIMQSHARRPGRRPRAQDERHPPLKAV